MPVGADPGSQEGRQRLWHALSVLVSSSMWEMLCMSTNTRLRPGTYWNTISCLCSCMINTWIRCELDSRVFWEWTPKGCGRCEGYHYVAARGVTRRLDDAQVWSPHVRTDAFRKQMYCIEESTCDIVGTFRCPPQWFGTVASVPPSCALRCGRRCIGRIFLNRTLQQKFIFQSGPNFAQFIQIKTRLFSL